MLYFEKTEKYLSTILKEYYKQFIIYIFEIGHGLDNITHAINIENLEWGRLFREPVLELRFMTRQGSEITVKFHITNGGFNEFNDKDNITLGFSSEYEIPGEVEIKLFSIFVREILEKQTNRCPIHIFNDIPQKVLDIMFEENYFQNNYSVNELIKIYSDTKNENFLPPDIVDIFLF